MTGNELIKQILDKKLGDVELCVVGTDFTGNVDLDSVAAINEVTKEVADDDEEYGALVINEEINS